MKKTWWSVPLYCMAASWIGYHLEISLLGRWAVVTLPDGALAIDSVRSMILSAVLFLAVVGIGGFLFFRRMTRREIFCSASILVVMNVVLGIFTYQTQHTFLAAALLWAQLSQWDDVFSKLLYELGLNEWLRAAVLWILPPYTFLLFGKREVHGELAKTPPPGYNG